MGQMVDPDIVYIHLAASPGLRNLALVIKPPWVRRGQEAQLHCQYEMEGAPLYSVKWYRGTLEFYRYSPFENPPAKIFPFTGIKVDLKTFHPECSVSNLKTADGLNPRTARATTPGSYLAIVVVTASRFRFDVDDGTAERIQQDNRSLGSTTNGIQVRISNTRRAEVHPGSSNISSMTGFGMLRDRASGSTFKTCSIRHARG
ncbi:conserved hypothetical protein [Culex quinquefasciatus]|uniref:Ig-like domain-containing protein n=1 Tax=Culex quinquefasciatus TaxID=7176 RepID=B0WJU8_CULQU|nr:conserved hypothetical protein [Culex quinquefasciatus]|eukprot:XP_001848982.1 conserved hypothetical protein [Culex quinquefasciatus]